MEFRKKTVSFSEDGVSVAAIKLNERAEWGEVKIARIWEATMPKRTQEYQKGKNLGVQ